MGEPFLTPIATTFKRRYAGITIEAFDEPGTQSRERVIAEQKTGRLIGDIIIAGPTNHQILTDLNYLEPFKTSQWAQMIPELLPDIPNANPLRASIFSIAINSKLIPAAEEPKAGPICCSQDSKARWLRTIRAAAAAVREWLPVWRKLSVLNTCTS